ncbi:MAG: hypothetical protein J5835_04995 [Bacteroidales bacterium]|nr:hypothetical protein [Bacteroidales bacterium]
MKKYLILVVLAIAATIIFTSFGFSLPSQFEHFVDKVEKNASEYTEKDWSKASEQFNKLMDKYKESYDTISDEDKERIDKSIGKYRAIVFRSGFNRAIESFNEYMKIAGPKLQSLSRRLGSFIEELTKDPGE